jgi:hypothetical protein
MKHLENKQILIITMHKSPTPKKNLKQARVNIQLLPAFKVNIIIVNPRGVVLPRATPRVNTYDVHLKCRQ